MTYAKELRDTAVEVNAVNPGYCATDLHGHSGVLTVGQAAAISVRLALVGVDGPIGGFFQDEGPCHGRTVGSAGKSGSRLRQ